jgi:hemoglobin
MRKLCFALVLVIGGTMGGLACGGAQKVEGGDVSDGKSRSLYERLGGKDAITAVVDDFLVNVLADNRINARFANSDKPKLRGHLIDQICQATGGPCKYTGRTMLESHTGMKVSEEEFTALVEDLIKSLDKLKVPKQEKDELLGALGGMKGDIVGK